MLRNFVLSSLLAVSACALSLPAQAQDLVGAKDGPSSHEHKFDPAKFEQMRQQHLEREKALLHITPAQESAWQSYVSATKPTPHQHHEDWKANAKLSEPERMEKMLTRFKEMEGKMQAHLIALKQFYGQLSPEQRTIFELTHKHHDHFAHRGHRGHRHHDGTAGATGSVTLGRALEGAQN